MPDRFERFTDRARKVLQLAQEEAQRLNHNYIGTEHLLPGPPGRPEPRAGGEAWPFRLFRLRGILASEEASIMAIEQPTAPYRTISLDETGPEDALQLRGFLEALLQEPASTFFLLHPSGQRRALPRAYVEALSALAALRSVGTSEVYLLPDDAELTTQEAADLLQVSRPHVVKLLNEGLVPYRMVGTHHRIPLRAVLVYLEEQRCRTGEALDDLAAMSQALGLYDKDAPSKAVRR
jgi:excisionase family DNA binding protein